MDLRLQPDARHADRVGHPFLPIQIKNLLTRKDDRADITIFLVSLPAGKEIPEHVHETQEDIIFILAGKAKMRIEGVGEFNLEKGAFIRVPKNTKHRIYDVTEADCAKRKGTFYRYQCIYYPLEFW